MSRAEYLKELGERIESLPTNERREVLADYEEHFQMGRSAGKSDDEIIRSLGTPKSVAQEILANTYVAKAEKAGPISERYGALLHAVLMVLILAPFNFLVLVCPFLILLTFIFVGWVLAVSVAAVGIVMLLLAMPSFAILSFFGGLSFVSASVGTLGLAILGGMAMIVITRGAVALVLSYCKWNLNLIRARKA